MTNAELTNLATQLEETRVKAMVDADMSTLNELLSDELYYGHTGGYVDDKAAFLEKIKSGVYKYESIKVQIADVKAVGGSGIAINGDLTIVVNPPGGQKVFHAIYVAVWRLEAGDWKFLSLQAAFKK